MKKILILYASYGGGHFSAAKALKKHIDENYSDCETMIVDCMKYINKAIEKITTDAYKEMAKMAPWMWKEIYNKSQKGLLSKISNDSNKIMAVKMNTLFKEYNPDIVISTHPFSSQMTSYLKKKGKTNCKLATVMTDFEPHNQWIEGSEFVDYFFVSNNDMKEAMINYNNIDNKKIHVTGIPISERFTTNYDSNQILKDFNLKNNKKTILFFGGGEYGLGKNKNIQILKELISTDYDIQIIAISGKNKKLKINFEEIAEEFKCSDKLKVLSFTDKIPELMSISDLVITKPGGLTTSEALASNLPIIVINPIPGQEEANAAFLENSGCAVWMKKISNTKNILNSVIKNEKKLIEMKNNTKKLAKPNSTNDICRIILSNN